jgi:hypothetical protein
LYKLVDCLFHGLSILSGLEKFFIFLAGGIVITHVFTARNPRICSRWMLTIWHVCITQGSLNPEKQGTARYNQVCTCAVKVHTGIYQSVPSTYLYFYMPRVIAYAQGYALGYGICPWLYAQGSTKFCNSIH